MAVESIGAVAAGSSGAAGATRAGLGQEDFLEILLTQLTYQDPLEPLDNQEFIAQLAQFSALQQTSEINTKLEGLQQIGSANQAVTLIGRTVQVQTDTGFAVGLVSTATYRDGVPKLVVQTTDNRVLVDIGLSQISVVR